MAIAFKKSLIISTIALYFAVSMQVFDSVYGTSRTIIDELFHIPQGMQYCNQNFTHWDSKITTLPGLYIISTLLVGPFLKCSPYLLRFTNLLASCVNIYFLNSIALKLHKQTYDLKSILQVVNIALLPPLYFFSHLYYTDTLALTFVLIFLDCYLGKDRHLTLTLSGAFAVIVRQTNVLWVAFCFGNTLIDLSVHSYIADEKSSTTLDRDKQIVKTEKDRLNVYTFNDLLSSVKFHIATEVQSIAKFITANHVCEIVSMMSILIGFTVFVHINGSIVVGDKSAHTASMHIPQLFYFLLFYGCFSIPYVFRNILGVMKSLFKNKLTVLLLLGVGLAAVHYNTLVHPYLLADNRHYTFYVWNKFYGKYWYARYVAVPVYIVLGFSLFENLKNSTSAGFCISFSLSLFLAVALQKMIEVRYFLIPYVILKMRFDVPSWTTLAVDFAFNCIVNCITFNIFFTKEIIWDDFADVQRLMW